MSADLLALSLHPFGNYAVQVLLKQSPPQHLERLTRLLLPNIFSLARSKHGSNVAETLVILFSPDQVRRASLRLVSAVSAVSAVSRRSNSRSLASEAPLSRCMPP